MPYLCMAFYVNRYFLFIYIICNQVYSGSKWNDISFTTFFFKGGEYMPWII